MKLAIVGSRTLDWIDLPKLIERHQSSEFTIPWDAVTEIVSGGANGIDAAAAAVAMVKCLPFKVFAADWNKHGKAAGPIRNSQIVEYSDACLAVWDGKSSGTRDTMQKFVRANKQLYLIAIAVAQRDSIKQIDSKLFKMVING